MRPADPIDWRDVARVFEEIGFVLRRDYPESAAYHKIGTALPVTLPKVSNVKLFIIRANCRVAAIDEEEFFRRLNRIRL